MKILVRGNNWVGDAVMSVPALKRLRASFPSAHIALQTRPWAAGVFDDSGLAHEIIEMDPGRRSPLGEARGIRDRKFDAAIIFPNSFSSAFAARIARIPHRFGYDTERRGFLLSERVPVPDWKSRRHEVFYYLNLVQAFERRLLGRTEDVGEHDTSLAVSERRRESARAMLGAGGIDFAKPVIAMAPGSTNSAAKRWGAERYAELVNLLRDSARSQVVLLGSASESDVAGEISFRLGRPVADLTGKTSIAEAAAVLAVCDLLVANDMGLAHLAPAVGTRAVVIFGPTDPVTTRPYSDLAAVVRVGVECSPCMLRECPIDHRCMTRIEPRDVFAKIQNLLTNQNG